MIKEGRILYSGRFSAYDEIGPGEITGKQLRKQTIDPIKFNNVICSGFDTGGSVANITETLNNTWHLEWQYNAADSSGNLILPTTGTASGLTIRRAGVYHIIMTTNWAANGTGDRINTILVNSTAWLPATNGAIAIGGATTWLQTSSLRRFAVGDLIQTRCYQNSGGNLTINSTYLQVMAVELD